MHKKTMGDKDKESTGGDCYVSVRGCVWVLCECVWGAIAKYLHKYLLVSCLVYLS